MSKPHNDAYGAMTAESVGEDDFEADFGFAINPGADHWLITAAETRKAPGYNRGVFLNVPRSLPANGEVRQYLMSPSGKPEDTWAYYISGPHFVPSDSGVLTIQNHGDQKRMTGSFEFKAHAGGHQFHLKKGLFDITESISSASRATNLFTAEITGAISATLSTNQIGITKRPEAGAMGVSALYIDWESSPPQVHDFVLIIPEDAKEGTYQIGKTGDLFNATHKVISANGGYFQSTEGTITLHADASVDHLEATLSFTAIAHGDPVKTVQVKNGTIIFQRPPAK